MCLELKDLILIFCCQYLCEKLKTLGSPVLFIEERFIAFLYCGVQMMPFNQLIGPLTESLADPLGHGGVSASCSFGQGLNCHCEKNTLGK